MRRHVRIVSIVAVCALAAVGCNRSDGTADAEQNESGSAMHVTGCVERGVIPGTFMLTAVDLAGSDASAGTTIPGGSPGTSGQADDRSLAAERAGAHTAATQRYTLRSLDRGSDLGPYVGKRVTVAGRLTAVRDQTGIGTRGTPADESKPMAGSDTLRSDRPGGTAAAGTTAAVADVRQLDAESIRIVADTCTPADAAR